jgi:TolB-like protein/DNA-binding winged helix-turn-helix (wHTH) protein/Tfp pilus assembly protein PilF
MTDPVTRLYEFGRFRVDPVKRLLLRDRQVVPITPKAFDTLFALLQNVGRVIEKDELMKAVWGDTIVEEGGLTRNISVLRKTLGESLEDHQYIVTVPGRGYRFVANVRETVEERAGLSLEKQPESPKTIEERQSATGNVATAIPSITSGWSLITRLRSRKRGVVVTLAALVVAAAAITSFTWESLRGKRGAAINSIAVLPFANIDPNTEYLSDGITESLINSLSQLSQLKVTARTTAFHYKGKDADPRTVGSDLKVDAVLTGKVVQQGDSLLVQADLVNTVDGTQIWGERYNRKLSDIFTMQEEIARQISDRLRVRLSGAERKQITKRYTENVEAYQLYMRGRSEAEKRTKEAYQKALEHYKQALNLDSNYAPAYVGLADVYFVGGAELPPKESALRSKAAATKALEIDETLGEAHTSLARVLWQFDWDWESARKEFKRSLEIDPNNAFTHRIYGYYLSSMGQHDDAVTEMRLAQQLDPLSPIINLGVGIMLYFAGQNEQAMAQFRKTQEQEMGGGFSEAYRHLGLGYCQMGKYVEGVAACEKGVALSPDSSQAISFLGYAYGRAGKGGEAIKRLDQLKESSKREYVSSFYIAAIYSGLGEKDQAFEWLHRACEERFGLLVYLKYWPIFENLRSDPRFTDLLRCVGIRQ